MGHGLSVHAGKNSGRHSFGEAQADQPDESSSKAVYEMADMESHLSSGNAFRDVAEGT